MQEIIINTQKISGSVFFCVFVAIFYLSIKKCFLTDGKSQIKLFFTTLITQPYMIFILSGMLGILLFLFTWHFWGENSDSFASYYNNLSFLSSVIMVIITGIFNTLLVFFCSYIVGKKMKVKNVSLVTYVYLMFSVIVGLADNTGNVEKMTQQYILVILHNIILIVALFLIYNLIIKELAKVADSKKVTNWKTFLIPPAVFILFYYPVDYCSYELASYETHLATQIFHVVVLFLFIWAFYIIINNINATNEAIVAKDETKTLSVEVMEALANTIDAKDKYTNGHSIRVAKYSRMIAEKMGLSDDICENIYYMGLLHDIGKIGVPNEIINKPARLNDEEYDIIKTHPVIGYKILSKIQSRPDLSKGARWHHERYDGKGYPDKIEGDSIPLESRIIAVADAYDAMTSNRSYRQFLPQDTVRAEIEKCSGTQFDPEIAKYMLMIIDEDGEYILHE